MYIPRPWGRLHICGWPEKIQWIKNMLSDKSVYLKIGNSMSNLFTKSSSKKKIMHQRHSSRGWCPSQEWRSWCGNCLEFWSFLTHTKGRYLLSFLCLLYGRQHLAWEPGKGHQSLHRPLPSHAQSQNRLAPMEHLSKSGISIKLFARKQTILTQKKWYKIIF